MEDQKKSEQTIHMICEKTIDLMESTPFYKIKVTDICSQLHISRSTFYLYFDSVYAVVQKIEDNFFANLLDDDEFRRSDFQRFSSKFNDVVESDIRKFRILVSDNGDPCFVSRINRRARKHTQIMLRNRKQIEKDVYIDYMVAGSWSLMKRWCENPEKFTRSQYEEAVTYFLKLLT